MRHKIMVGPQRVTGDMPLSQRKLQFEFDSWELYAIVENFRTVKQLREYVALGVVNSVRIMRVPMKAGCWYLFVNGLWILATSKGTIREFSSVDTAISVVQELGLNVADLNVGGVG